MQASLKPIPASKRIIEFTEFNLSTKVDVARPTSQARGKSDPKHCLNVFERNKEWQEYKDQKQKVRREQTNLERSKKELAECKFKPDIIHLRNKGVP